MRIIFLDIDGVLIKYTTGKSKELPKEFDQDLADNLKHLLSVTDARIVISSSWRHHLQTCKEAFIKADLDWNRVISVTEYDTNGWRSTEILQWLDNYHKTCKAWYHITHWCTIDDEYYEMKALRRLGKLVKTDVQEGLTMDKVQEVITLLT